MWEHRPLDAAAIAEAEQRVAEETRRPYVQRALRQCERHPERFGASSGDPADCAEAVLPQVNWFLDRPVLDPVELAGELPVVLALFLGVIAVLIGATMIGAEWSAGSVGTQLLFEPRRPRVWAAKAAAIALVTAVMAAVVFALVWAGILAAYAAWSDDGLPAGFLGDLGASGLRAAAFAGIGGLAGYAVTMAARHTVVVVGLMLAYSVIGEGLLREFVPRLERYLVSNNTLAWIQDGHRIRIHPEFCNTRAECRPTVTVISLADAALYFGVVAAAMLLISLAVFRHRDVP